MEQHIDKLDQDTNGLTLERLPTGFFPSPQETTSRATTAVTSTTSTTEHPRTIVVAYDYSNYSDAMIAKSIRLGLLRTTDNIHIVHIVNQMDYRAMFNPMISDTGTQGNLLQDRDLDKRMETAADNFIYEMINVLRKHGFQKVSSDVLRGDPKESITDYCRMTKPLFLISGTRGLGAVKRTMMGSVSSYLTRHCPCPVLIVKLDPAEIEARKELNDKKQANFHSILETFSGAQADGPFTTTNLETK